MKLYLLRHGEAVDVEQTDLKHDATRTLTTKGIQQTQAVTDALRQMKLSFGAIFSSPLVRARQTAEIVERDLLLHGRVELTDHLSPTGDVEKLLEQLASIRPVADNILLVGHEPYLSGLISLLCIGGAGLSLALKKSGLCRLEVESLRAPQCATLEWLMTPRLFESKRPKGKKARI